MSSSKDKLDRVVEEARKARETSRPWKCTRTSVDAAVENLIATTLTNWRCTIEIIITTIIHRTAATGSYSVCTVMTTSTNDYWKRRRVLLKTIIRNLPVRLTIRLPISKTCWIKKSERGKWKGLCPHFFLIPFPCDFWVCIGDLCPNIYKPISCLTGIDFPLVTLIMFNQQFRPYLFIFKVPDKVS